MKHPMGLYVISISEMFERFSFYIFSSILVLFMYDVLHFSMPFCTFLFGIIIGATYFFQLVAGYISDAYIGNRKAIIFGGIMMVIAQLIFAYDGSLYLMAANVSEHSSFLLTYPEIIFLIGAVVMTIGVSFFKVSITSFAGLFYDEGDDRIDSAYTIFYMMINLGGFFSPLIINFVCGVNNPSAYQYCFLIAAIAVLAGVIFFIFLKDRYLFTPDGAPIGVKPISQTERIQKKKKENAVSEKLSKIEINRLEVIGFVLVIIVVFFVSHEQISTSFINIAMNYVDNVVPFTSYELNPSFYLSLNPLFIILLSPLFIKFCSSLANRGKEPSSISKLGIGLAFVALSYLVLLISLDTMGSDMRIHMGWMAVFNALLVIAELFIMPVALSLISKLAPVRYVSLMVGVLFAANGVAEIISGLFASACPETVNQTTLLFDCIPIDGLGSFLMLFIVISVVVAILWFLVKNKIKKLSHGID